ncbi:replication initiator protein [robinz microvirus RP_142]|nr:replication initiator protein [robinz microvirus RP_142]
MATGCRMKCEDPYTDAGGAFSCGKCPACLSIRRRTWAHRIHLESMQHAKASAFITLTYSEDKLPVSLRELPTLEPSHLRDWLKRFRKAVYPRSVRSFHIGEYGDLSERPHYHIALFGLGCCSGGPVETYIKDGKLNFKCLCEMCSVVRTTWGFGHIMVGTLTAQSAMYIAGYVVKRMTSSQDHRLGGRYREFAHMSLFPGIGAYALTPVVSAVSASTRTVPPGLRHSERVYPLGRYIRRKVGHDLSDGSKEGIRAALGSGEAQDRVQKGMQLVRRYAFDNDLSVSEVFNLINPKTGSYAPKGKTL